MRLVKIDLKKRYQGCQHPDIKADVPYLAKVDNFWYAGTFTKQHYGWNFNAVYGAGLQLNSSSFKKLYRILER